MNRFLGALPMAIVLAMVILGQVRVGNYSEGEGYLYRSLLQAAVLYLTDATKCR